MFYILPNSIYIYIYVSYNRGVGSSNGETRNEWLRPVDHFLWTGARGASHSKQKRIDMALKSLRDP